MLEPAPRKWRPKKELLWSSRTTLEKASPWEILLLREIQGKTHPDQRHFEKVNCESEI
jgi:hypothetical protein